MEVFSFTEDLPAKSACMALKILMIDGGNIFLDDIVSLSTSLVKCTNIWARQSHV